MTTKGCLSALLLVPVLHGSVNAADAGYQYMTNEQISSLTREQVASITDANLARLPVDWIANLVNPSRNVNDPRFTGRVKVKDWKQNHAQQHSRLTDYQISRLRRDKFGEICAYDFENISIDTVQRLDVSAISAHEIPALLEPSLIPETTIMTYSFSAPEHEPLLSNSQIKGLQPQQLAVLRCDDLYNIPDDCIQELNTEQINALSPISISYLVNPSRFVVEPVQNHNAIAGRRQSLLSKDQFNNLSPEQLNHLTSDTYDVLPNEYTALLDKGKKAELFPRCLSPEKFAGLPNGELVKFSDAQLNRLKLTQITQLNQNQLQLFHMAQLPAKGVDYAQRIRNIPPIRIRALTIEELNQLMFA